MLNNFAFEFLRSLKSLLAEMKRHIRLATNISQAYETLLSDFKKLLKQDFTWWDTVYFISFY